MTVEGTTLPHTRLGRTGPDFARIGLGAMGSYSPEQLASLDSER